MFPYMSGSEGSKELPDNLATSHPPLGKVEPNITFSWLFSGAFLAPPFPKVDTRG